MSQKLYKGERALKGVHWWVEGNLTADEGGHLCIRQDNTLCFKILPKSVGMFTGRHDSSPNKIKIFENDIVLFKRFFVPHVGVVTLNKQTGHFEIIYLSKHKKTLKNCAFWGRRHLIVVGNSHRNTTAKQFRKTIEFGYKVYEAKRSKKIKSFTCPIYGRPQYMKFYDSCIGMCDTNACDQCQTKNCACRLIKKAAGQKNK